MIVLSVYSETTIILLFCSISVNSGNIFTKLQSKGKYSVEVSSTIIHLDKIAKNKNKLKIVTFVGIIQKKSMSEMLALQSPSGY